MHPDRTTAAKPGLIVTLLGILAGVAFAIAAWAVWVSFERIHPAARPHMFFWEFVLQSQIAHGVHVPLTVSDNVANPLIRAALVVTSHRGNSLAAITSVQLPFLVAVIVGSALVAWRLRGRFAAILAAWFAALAPTTLGPALSMTDQLAMQACVCLTVALLMWSWDRGIWYVGLLAAAPPMIAARVSTWFTNALIALLVLSFAGAGTLAWAWTSYGRRLWSGNSETRWLPAPRALTAFVALALVAGFFATWPFPLDYLFSEEANEQYDALSIVQNPYAIVSCVGVWIAHMAGPALAAITVLSAAFAIRRRQFLTILPTLAWLVLPLAAFTILNKRHDFYLIAAAPAAYPLAAIGLSLVTPGPRRTAAAAGAVAAAFAGFLHIVGSDIPERPVWHLQDIFEGVPRPYLHSPFSDTPEQYEEVADLLIKRCVLRNRPIYIVDHPDMIAYFGIDLWQRFPKLPIGTILDRRVPSVEHCLLTQAPLARGATPDLSRILDNYTKSELGGLDQDLVLKIMARLGHIRANRDAYRAVGTEHWWTLWVSAPPRAP
ncbi:hypothetical protein K8I61_02925 [bacterium]|nr:hypothetical protein [bacterium]